MAQRTNGMKPMCFNPYFIGLPILIAGGRALQTQQGGFNPYFIGLPILITTIL